MHTIIVLQLRNFFFKLRFNCEERKKSMDILQRLTCSPLLAPISMRKVLIIYQISTYGCVIISELVRERGQSWAADLGEG